MSYQRLRIPGEGAAADSLARAIRKIDRTIELHRLAGEPAPLGAYRARRILAEAHLSCQDGPSAQVSGLSCTPAAPPDALTVYRAGRDPVERHEALPGPQRIQAEPEDFGCYDNRNAEGGLCLREDDRSLHAHEGTGMTYDWTGQATRKRNPRKLAMAMLLSAAVVLGIPAVVSRFL